MSWHLLVSSVVGDLAGGTGGGINFAKNKHAKKKRVNQIFICILTTHSCSKKFQQNIHTRNLFVLRIRQWD